MQPDGPLADIEAAYLVARDAHDAALLARATGQGGDPDALSSAAGAASVEARRRLEALPEATVAGLGAEDRVALEVMQERLTELAASPSPVTPSAAPTPSDRAAELRAAIRERRGDWLDGDPGWYPWVRDHLFRFGRERTSGQVVRDMLGRRPTADALLVEIARVARPPQVV